MPLPQNDFVQISVRPLAFLLYFADAPERIILDSYDASYTTDLTRIHRATNYSSLTKLLRDFFIFFADFDFTYYVICPRIGKAIPVLEIDQHCEYKEGTFFKVMHLTLNTFKVNMCAFYGTLIVQL